MKKNTLYVVFSAILLIILPIKSNSQSARELYNVAIAEFNNGNYKSSLNNLDKVLSKIGSTNARIQYYKSKCYYELQEYYQCKQEVMKYRKTNRDNASWDQEMNLLYNKANEAIDLEKVRKANEEYANSPKGNPNFYLRHAIENNDLDYLIQLVSYGADVNHLCKGKTKNHNSSYALEVALNYRYMISKNDYQKLKKNYDIIDFLLREGANPNKKRRESTSYEYGEVSYSNSIIYDMIVYHKYDDFYFETLNLLFAHGAKMQEREDHKEHPLKQVITSSGKNEEIKKTYKYLMENSLHNTKVLWDIAIKHNNNNDLLFLAKFLMDNGANPKGKYLSSKPKTPIQKAKMLKKVELVELMKQY